MKPMLEKAIRRSLFCIFLTIIPIYTQASLFGWANLEGVQPYLIAANEYVAVEGTVEEDALDPEVKANGQLAMAYMMGLMDGIILPSVLDPEFESKEFLDPLELQGICLRDGPEVVLPALVRFIKEKGYKADHSFGFILTDFLRSEHSCDN